MQVTFVNELRDCLNHSLSCHDNLPWRRRQHVPLKRWHLCTNTRYHIPRQLPPCGLSVCFISSLTSVAVYRLCITVSCQRNLCSCIISNTSKTQRFSSYLTKKSASFTQNMRLLPYRDITAVFGQNDAKSKYTVCKQSKAFSVKRCWMFTRHNTLEGYFFTGYIIRPFSEHAVSIPTFCLSLVTSTSRPLRGCWSAT